MRHKIVHNVNVVADLEGLARRLRGRLERVPEARPRVLRRTAFAPAVKETRRARPRVVDATCPLVNKVHAEAPRYADSGHLVALVGHANHVEVIGTLGERPGSTVVIESPEQARRLRSDKPIAVITQTTIDQAVPDRRKDAAEFLKTCETSRFYGGDAKVTVAQAAERWLSACEKGLGAMSRSSARPFVATIPTFGYT